MDRPFNVTDTINMLTGSLNFLSTYTRDTFPSMVMLNGLSPRTFHKADKDKYRNKIPWNCADAATQVRLAKACLAASEVVNNYRWIETGNNIASAFTNYFFVENPVTPVVADTDPAFKPYQFQRLVVARGNVQLKGSQNEEDPYNFGNFDTILSFTSGLTVIPSGSNGMLTSDVFKVYPTASNLLYKNVNSPLLGNDSEYTIEYFVSNYNLEGQNYRIYPNGTFTITSETSGTIKLVSNFTGNAKVLWANYTNTVAIAPTSSRTGQGLIETFPINYACSRLSGYHLNSTFSGFYDAYNLFSSYQALAYDSNWANYANALKYSLISALNIDNKSYIYKKESYSNTTKNPGIILTSNNSRDLTGLLIITRDSVTGHFNQLKAVATGSVTSIKLENLVTAINFLDTTQLSIEASSSTETILNVTLSQSVDYTLTTNDYSAQLLLPATSVTTTRTFTRKNFIKTDFTKTLWTSVNKSNTVTASVTGTGSVNTSRVQTTVNDWQPVITQIVFNKSVATDTAIAILTNATFNNTSPKIIYSSTGGTKIKVKNSSGQYFSFQLPNTSGNWLTLQIDISALSNLNELSIETTEIIPNTFQLFFIGSTPESMPLGTVYKSTLTDSFLGVHTLWIGDCYATGNNLETLPYYPGITPESKEVFKNGSTYTKGKIYGNAAINYLDPYTLSQIGYATYTTNQLQMLSDAFDNYTISDISNANKLLSTLYIPAFWNNVKFADTQGIKLTRSNHYYKNNYFASSYNDPDFDNFTIVARTVENLSKYLQTNTNNETAKKLITNFLTFLQKYYIAKNSNQPPTTVLNPISTFHSPENAALIGKVAVHSNLSGLDAALTIDIIKRSYDYLVTQYVSSSDNISSMTGSWSKGQSSFSSNSISYRQYTTSYHTEVIDFFATLLKNGNNLNYPYVYTPNTFPNITPNYIDNIKLPSYKNSVNKFTDNEQTVLFSNTGTGLELTLKYTLIDANKLQTLMSFWKTQGGKAGSFALPTAIWKHPEALRNALNLNNLQFTFADKINFDIRVANKIIGLWNVEIKLIQTIRKTYDKKREVNLTPYFNQKTTPFSDVGIDPTTIYTMEGYINYEVVNIDGFLSVGRFIYRGNITNFKKTDQLVVESANNQIWRPTGGLRNFNVSTTTNTNIGVIRWTGDTVNDGKPISYLNGEGKFTSDFILTKIYI
jgi:hypothetical protein